MSELDELQDMNNWDIKTEYGPHDYEGIIFSWIGYSTPPDLAKEAADELAKLRAAVDEARKAIEAFVEWDRESKKFITNYGPAIDAAAAWLKAYPPAA